MKDTKFYDILGVGSYYEDLKYISRANISDCDRFLRMRTIRSSNLHIRKGL